MVELKPVTLNIFLGPTQEAQDRRAAYQKAADKSAEEKEASLGKWARELLDKASGFKK